MIGLPELRKSGFAASLNSMGRLETELEVRSVTEGGLQLVCRHEPAGEKPQVRHAHPRNPGNVPSTPLRSLFSAAPTDFGDKQLEISAG